MRVLVLGAGRMGFGAAYDLVHNSPDVSFVTLADAVDGVAESAVSRLGTDRARALKLDVAERDAVLAELKDHDAAISCVNYWFNEELSKLSILAGASFCDLGGNNSVVDRQLKLDEEAKEAGVNIIPDCGLAPGMVSVLAMHGLQRFDSVRSLKIRVGGLPRDPQPPLEYQLIFSVEGLINEYVEKARVIRSGKIVEIESMSEIEPIEFEGLPPLEAFQTSGGTSTLPDSLRGQVDELDYKTIRYAGHCDKFKTMIDLGLCSGDAIDLNSKKVVPRKVFGRLLEMHLPADGPDLVVVRLMFEGEIDGESRRLNYDIVDAFDEETGLSAMMRTTSFPASIVAQMAARGEVSERGATPQEKVINPAKFVSELDRRGILIKERFSA